MTNKQLKAAQARKEIFEICIRTGRGHIATAFSCVDILTCLYYNGWIREQDSLIVSKGHGNVALYPILADLGFFPKDELDKYATSDGILRLHADPSIPGVHYVGGSLGNGIGYGAGLALVAKNDGKDKRVYILCGDAELHEGSIWESVMFSSHQKLGNIVVIVDRNKYGTIGSTEKLLAVAPIGERFRAFGWAAADVNGHDFDAIESALYLAERHRVELSYKPQLIVAHTVKGKGISFMEDDWTWHVKHPQGEQIDRARTELNSRVKGLSNG
jgi:transketolase